MRLTSLAFACALSASSALAQEAAPVENGQSFGNWVVNCQALAPGRTACVLGQRILRSEDRAFVAQLLAFQSPDGAKTYLSARVPTGVYFPAGFAMRPQDGEDIIQFVWQSCGRDLCEAVTEIDPDKLAEFAAEGKNMVGAFRPSVNQENFVFQFSLTGAPEGLAALKAASE